MQVHPLELALTPLERCWLAPARTYPVRLRTNPTKRLTACRSPLYIGWLSVSVLAVALH